MPSESVTANTKYYGYGINSWLYGANAKGVGFPLDDVKLPARTCQVAECSTGIANYRPFGTYPMSFPHDNAAVVLFVDGHTQTIKMAEVPDQDNPNQPSPWLSSFWCPGSKSGGKSWHDNW